MRKKIANQAQFFATRPFSAPYIGAQGACGKFERIILKDDNGKDLCSIRVEMKERWDAEATNKMRTKGAFYFVRDDQAVESAIRELSAQHPDVARNAIRTNV